MKPREHINDIYPAKRAQRHQTPVMKNPLNLCLPKENSKLDSKVEERTMMDGSGNILSSKTRNFGLLLENWIVIWSSPIFHNWYRLKKYICHL